MSFGFLGIQVGFALQNANVSRIFQSLGASIDDLPDAVARRAGHGPARATGHRLPERPDLGPAWGGAGLISSPAPSLATLALVAMPN